MVVVFKLLILTVYLSITCNGNIASETSGFECRIPDNSSIDYPINVHVNLSEEEFDLLQIEGRCFLFCATEKYSNEIGMGNYSLSTLWPFISIDQTKCSTAFKVHECTRGCLRRHRDTFPKQCNMICQQTCHSVVELQECGELFECHPWISLTGCQNLVCDEVNLKNPFLACPLGCGTDDLEKQESAPPLDPIGPPQLIQDHSTGTDGEFKFIVDLLGAAPLNCETVSTFTDALSVAFLFKFVDMNSGNVSYKWTASPFEHLDLADYVCQKLLVSFAVSNKRGLSMFSPAIPLIINGDKRLIPIPPSNLQISDEIDERVGFFGHVILNISWNAPQNNSYLDYYTITITTAAGFNTTMCGCTPWTRKVQLNESSLSIQAISPESLPLISCSYNIQIRSVSRFGASYPTVDTYAVNTTFDGQSISFECQRLWQTKGISFNLTWVLSPYLYRHHVISSFAVDLELIDLTNNITYPIDTTNITFPQESPMIFTNTLGDVDHNLNMTFLETLLVHKSWDFHLVTYVMWNISGPYIPPKHTYTCVQSTFYPVPGPIDDLSITSCSVRGSNISVELQWSPPSVIIGELHSYDICTGNIPLVPDQEIPNNGSHKCLHLNKELNHTLMENQYSNYSLYVQIRATTVHGTGNWSEPHGTFSLCHPDQRVVDSHNVDTIMIGISLMSCFLALIFLFSLLGLTLWITKMLRQRKKPHRMVKWPHDPIFSGGRRNLHLQRILASPQIKQDRWEIPLSGIIFKDLLGEGAFGEVYRGIIKCPIVSPKRQLSGMKKSIYTLVAIKRLKSSAQGNERQDFLSEIEMMKKVAEGQNPHVIGLLGCVTIQEPLCLITEFVKFGDLLSYLRINRRMCAGSNTDNDDKDDAYLELGNVSPVDLVSFAYQITSGMEYLSSLGIVHRDLACRNILVDKEKKLKITDFGLSREADEIYVQKREGRVPLKWMAIESIIAREFTSASDVWSFGVVLWEIGTLGGIPYPSIQNDDLLSMLKGGYRMVKPDNCSPEVYDIMLACWNEQSKERPTFKELRAKFDAMLLAEKKDMYIALFIGENKSNCQSLPPVTAKNDDENRLTRKLASSKVSTTSLDETRSAGRGKKSNCTRRRPDRLSLEVFTHGQQRQLEDRYVSSPAMSPILQKSEMERCIKENMPIIEISVSQNHL